MRRLKGKGGVTISKWKYDTAKQSISVIPGELGEMTFDQLNNAVLEELAGRFVGSTRWYYANVRLDIAAR